MTYCKVAIVTAIIGLLAGCGIPSINPSIDTSEWNNYWICTGGSYHNPGKLELYQRGVQGKVLQGELAVNTDYLTDGLERNWLWGSRDDGLWRYVIVLQGNAARYYNFGSIDVVKEKADEVYLNCSKGGDDLGDVRECDGVVPALPGCGYG